MLITDLFIVGERDRAAIWREYSETQFQEGGRQWSSGTLGFCY